MQRRLVFLLLLVFGSATCVSAADRPNIVLIVSDDHGWTDYGFMQHPQVETPRLDALAKQSLVFRRGYVPSSLCCPSLASLITGLYPHQHKITCNDPPMPAGMNAAEFHRSAAFTDGREAMNKHLEAVPTLPRLLVQEKYLSLQTGKWWQGDFRRGGFTHGMTRGQRHGDDGLEIGRKTMQPIFDFIQRAKTQQQPFLVWYAPMLPHEPHTPPERLLKKYQAKTSSLPLAKYWANIEFFDETCGQLLDYLDKEQLAENTIVVYLADNGWTQNPDASGSIRSKRTPYDAGVRTPILLRWPGKIEPRMSDDPAMSIDIVPTLLAALKREPTAAMQGINLLNQTSREERTAIFGECFVHTSVDLNSPAKNLTHRWVVAGHWKLIASQTGDQAVELYNLEVDPQEQNDLKGQEPDRVRELRTRLDDWWRPK